MQRINAKDKSEILMAARAILQDNCYKKLEKEYEKKVFIIMLGIVAIFTVMLSMLTQIDLAIPSTGNQYGNGEKRPGHYQDGVIWYIENTRHEINPEDYGIYDAEEGDKFTIYLDTKSPEYGYNSAVIDIVKLKDTKAAADTAATLLILCPIIMIIVVCVTVILLRYSQTRLQKFAQLFNDCANYEQFAKYGFTLKQTQVKCQYCGTIYMKEEHRACPSCGALYNLF